MGPSSRWQVKDGEMLLGVVRAETYMRALDLAKQTWRNVNWRQVTVRLIPPREGKREWASSTE